MGQKMDKKRPRQKLAPQNLPSIVGKQAYFTSQVIKTIRNDVTPDEHGLLSVKNLGTEVFVDPDVRKNFWIN